LRSRGTARWPRRRPPSRAGASADRRSCRRASRSPAACRRSGLHLLDRDLQRTRQALEQLGSLLRPADDAPIDGDGEDPLVVGEDPSLRVEDAAALRRQEHGALLAELTLAWNVSACTPCRNHSRVPSAPRRSTATSRACRDGCCDGQQPWHQLGRSRGATGPRAVVAHSIIAFHFGRFTHMHHRPSGTSSGLSSSAATATTGPR